MNQNLRAGVDLLWTVDNKYLSGKKVNPGFQAVVIRATAIAQPIGQVKQPHSVF